mgnify:CR=1 FL=1
MAPVIRRFTLSGVRLTVIEGIAHELQRIEEDATYSSKGHFEAAALWRTVNYWLGVPSAIGAGVASVSAFSDYLVASGIIAILVAALTSVSTFLDPSARANSHRVAGAAFLALKNQARILRTVELEVDADSGIQRFRELSERRDSLNSESPGIAWLAYTRAKAGIARGESMHATDKVEK